MCQIVILFDQSDLKVSAINGNHRVNISTRLEVSYETHPSGPEAGVEGVEDLVGAAFVGNIAINKGIDVKLDGLEFDDAFVGAVA